MPPSPPRAWQRMLSGRRLDLLDPSPMDVEIEDIAHGLSRVARWNGQTVGEHGYSVAQHSLLVEAVARTGTPGLGADALLFALLHDAPEYVIGDMISPFKAVLGGDYKGVEDRLSAAVHIRFGLPARPSSSLLALIKAADRAAARLEAVTLAGFSEEEAQKFFGRPAAAPRDAEAFLTPWTPEEAKRRFVARFHALSQALAPVAERS